jgi:threonine synthase
MQPEEAHTIADSISAGLPRDRAKALRAVRRTNGAMVAVSDADILASIPALARLTGVFSEPACAAVYAGAKRALELGYMSSSDSVALVLTGNGLKDIRRAQESVAGGVRVQPHLDAVRRALEK